MRLQFVTAVLAALLSTPVAAATLYWNNFEGQSKALQGAGARTDTLGYKDLGLQNRLWRNDASGGGAANASSLSFTLDTARAVRLNFDLAIIDSWDQTDNFGPDMFNVTVDGQTVFSRIFTGNFDAFTTPTIDPALTTVSFGSKLAKYGDWNDDWDDAAYAVSLLLGVMGAGDHTLSFYASGPVWQGGFDESFGLDNIRITSLNGDDPGARERVAEVPEPHALGLAAIALLCLGGTRRTLPLGRRKAARVDHCQPVQQAVPQVAASGLPSGC